MGVTSDDIIYQALCFVKLEKEYFGQNGSTTNNPELKNLRKIFDKVRREVLVTFSGYWCTKTVTLTTNPDFPPFYYQLPSDFLDTKYTVIIDSMFFSTALGAPGIPIFRLDCPDLTYVYDPEDLSAVPEKIKTYMQYKLLKKLMTQNIYEGGQAQLVQAAYEEAAREAQIEYAQINRLRTLKQREEGRWGLVGTGMGSVW
jgi:hypothetical protein